MCGVTTTTPRPFVCSRSQRVEALGCTSPRISSCESDVPEQVGRILEKVPEKPQRHPIRCIDSRCLQDVRIVSANFSSVSSKCPSHGAGNRPDRPEQGAGSQRATRMAPRTRGADGSTSGGGRAKLARFRTCLGSGRWHAASDRSHLDPVGACGRRPAPLLERSLRRGALPAASPSVPASDILPRRRRRCRAREGGGQCRVGPSRDGRRMPGCARGPCPDREWALPPSDVDRRRTALHDDSSRRRLPACLRPSTT